MARFNEVSDRLGFWQQKPRYDGAEYDLSHLQPLDRSMVARTGESIALRFRFSYHCCTDKPGRRDLGARVREDTRPEEDRHFCPVRWFLSLRLPTLARSLDTTRLAPWPDRHQKAGRRRRFASWWSRRAGSKNSMEFRLREHNDLGAEPLVRPLRHRLSAEIDPI